MTPAQAAGVIGCHSSHVRYLIRIGKLKASKVKTDPTVTGADYRYDITREEAERVRDLPPTRGYPRGKRRRK